MEITQYLLFTITTISGIFAGRIITLLTKDEQKNLQKYFHKIVLPFGQEKVFTTLGIIFAFFSPSKYFFLTAVLIFLYSIPVGSSLSAKNKELLKTAGIFVLAAVAFRLTLWEYYAK
ncbi:hypothetical protein HY484_01035 [Candidatus Woesearchaeota archaeon]|nr:hypothetical protein [Candidatus Woesearchaeota archaeon]